MAQEAGQAAKAGRCGRIKRDDGGEGLARVGRASKQGEPDFVAAMSNRPPHLARSMDRRGMDASAKMAGSRLQLDELGV
jgi:hypothetical protein